MDHARRFELHRDTDVSGVSGVGIVHGHSGSTRIVYLDEVTP